MSGAASGVRSEQRFTPSIPCPVCSGHDQEPRGEGQRCYGFISEDSQWARCTREEYAGNAPYDVNSDAYVHKLTGDCRCGVRHDLTTGGRDERNSGRQRKGRIVKTYDYHDEHGNVLYQTVRLEPKGFFQRRPDDKDGWINDLEGVLRAPYRLQNLLGADPDEPVLVPEGEEDVDRAREMMFVATCNVGGAGKWRDELSEHLRGRPVVIIPDNDTPGEKHAQKVARSVYGKAASVKVVHLPGLPEKGDLSDFFDAGGTGEDLRRLMNEQPDWMPPEERDDGFDGSDSFSTQRAFIRVPSFPVDALPAGCARYVKEAAESLLCAPELVAVPVLAALSGAMGFSRVLRIKYGWTVSASLYAAVVDVPGSRKSPAAGFAYKPLEKLQATLRKAYKLEKQTYESQMRQHAVDKRLAAKEGKPEPEPPVAPKMKRCIVDDITVEALAARLEQNPRGFLSAHDELTGFIRGLDQYKSGGKGNARQSYLKVWSNAPIYVDRKNSDEPIVVPNPYVTLQGAIQPSVLHEIANGRDDGFLDRFIFGYPEPRQGGYSEAGISAQAEKVYESVIGALWDKQHDRVEDEGIEPRVVRMDEEAKSLFVSTANGLAAEMHAAGFPEVLRGPWSKFDMHLARLALIIAVARSAEEQQREHVPEVVTGDDMRAALRLLEYFKATTRKVYGQLFEANSDDVLAADLVTLLRDSGYVFSGTITELMDRLDSDALPDTPEALGKAIRRIAKRSPDITVETKNTGDNRIITITLEKPSGPSEPSDDERVEGEL